MVLFIFIPGGQGSAANPTPLQWSEDEVRILKSLWLGSLPDLPKDLSNAYADNPKAIALGKQLFSDTRLSANGKVSCATCHIPDKTFTDSLPVSHGIGDGTRRSMPLAGTAYSPWFFWDGRSDSLWAQALGPIENPVEHGISRTKLALIINDIYKLRYEEIFGAIPELSAARLPPSARPAPDDKNIQALWDEIPNDIRAEINTLFSNIGKSIAAYVRTIQHGPSKFDRYIEGLLKKGDEAEKIYSNEEVSGLKLFIGKAQCINCHNGPLLTNNDFHDVGILQTPGSIPDLGRAQGMELVRSDVFNCMGRFSDAQPDGCSELKFMDTDQSKYEKAFKTPSLRNVADRPPYMHAGQIKTLREVIIFYRDISKQREADSDTRRDIVHSELTPQEISFLEAFLKTLSGPITSAQ